MKRFIKYFLIGVISLSFGLACNGEDTTTGAGPSGEEQVDMTGYSEDAISLLNNPNLPDELRPLVEASKVIEIPKTYIDLINEHEASGEIDEMTAHVYRLYAYEYPEKLIPIFGEAAAPRGHAELRAEVRWVRENFTTLPQNYQDDLKMFVLPPEDPGSYFNSLVADVAAANVSGPSF